MAAGFSDGVFGTEITWNGEEGDAAGGASNPAVGTSCWT